MVKDVLVENVFARINRKIIKRRITSKIITKYPELAPRFTNKILNETIVFINGYYKCFRKMTEPPYKMDEIMEHLYSEATDYVIRKISE